MPRTVNRVSLRTLINWGLNRGQERLPERMAILLTNPRSGSTWLFDALRCHPAIYVHPSSVICEGLDLSIIRRYPRDLSNGPDAIQEIEVQPGWWERIPKFDISDGIDQTPGRFLREEYPIEKIHPQFFNFDASAFLDSVSKLEGDGVHMRFIYHVRDPKASMTSFMSYQNRNPKWLPNEGIPLAAYMCQTYQAILEVARHQPGFIVDYADIATDLESVLQEVYCYLWPNPTSAEIDFMLRVSQAAVKATSRNKRAVTGSPFLGNKPGPIKGGAARHRDFFNRYKNEVVQCYRSYEFLLGLIDNPDDLEDRIDMCSSAEIVIGEQLKNG